MQKTFRFDYDRSLVSVSNSLLKYYNVKTYHPSLKLLDEKLAKNYKNVIFMILDGMGTDLIEKNLPETSFIRQHISAQIFSVFPPTTTAATTAGLRNVMDLLFVLPLSGSPGAVLLHPPLHAGERMAFLGVFQV